MTFGVEKTRMVELAGGVKSLRIHLQQQQQPVKSHALSVRDANFFPKRIVNT